MNNGDTKIQGLREYHTKNTVHFQVELNENYYRDYHHDMVIFEKLFKITGGISMKNMVGFNNQKKLYRYQTVKAIL